MKQGYCYFDIDEKIRCVKLCAKSNKMSELMDDLPPALPSRTDFSNQPCNVGGGYSSYGAGGYSAGSGYGMTNGFGRRVGYGSPYEHYNR